MKQITSRGVRPPSTWRVWLLLPLAALASTCDVLAPTEGRDRTELEHAWRTWQARNSDASYTYVQQRLCYCTVEATAAVRITVVEGHVVERRYETLPVPLPVYASDLWGTVDDLFRLIDDAISTGAHSLLVTYDPRLGYPTHISVDYWVNVADDELTITASKLELISTAADR